MALTPKEQADLEQAQIDIARARAQAKPTQKVGMGDVRSAESGDILNKPMSPLDTLNKWLIQARATGPSAVQEEAAKRMSAEQGPQLDAILKGLGKGYLANFADELAGTAASGLNRIGLISDETDENIFNKSGKKSVYEDYRDAYRGAEDEALAEHPALGTMAELYGALKSPTNKITGNKGPLPTGFIPRMFSGASSGLRAGLLYGAGGTKEPLEGAGPLGPSQKGLSDIGGSMLFSGLGGGVLTPVIAGAGDKLAGAVPNLVMRALGASKNKVGELANKEAGAAAEELTRNLKGVPEAIKSSNEAVERARTLAMDKSQQVLALEKQIPIIQKEIQNSGRIGRLEDVNAGMAKLEQLQKEIQQAKNASDFLGANFSEIQDVASKMPQQMIRSVVNDAKDLSQYPYLRPNISEFDATQVAMNPGKTVTPPILKSDTINQFGQDTGKELFNLRRPVPGNPEGERFFSGVRSPEEWSQRAADFLADLQTQGVQQGADTQAARRAYEIASSPAKPASSLPGFATGSALLGIGSALPTAVEALQHTSVGPATIGAGVLTLAGTGAKKVLSTPQASNVAAHVANWAGEGSPAWAQNVIEPLSSVTSSGPTRANLDKWLKPGAPQALVNQAMDQLSEESRKNLIQATSGVKEQPIGSSDMERINRMKSEIEEVTPWSQRANWYE